MITAPLPQTPQLPAHLTARLLDAASTLPNTMRILTPAETTQSEGIMASPSPERVLGRPSFPPAISRTSRPTLGSNLASIMSANHMFPILWDDSDDDDTAVSSAFENDLLDVVRIDDDDDESASKSRWLLPQYTSGGGVGKTDADNDISMLNQIRSLSRCDSRSQEMVLSVHRR